MERREFIGLLTVGTGGLLAGCSGDSEESTTPGTDQDGASGQTSESRPTATTDKETTATAETTTEQSPEQTTTVGPGRPNNKLVPETGGESELFGNAVAIDGETAVVGAIDAVAPSGDETGAAYAFTVEDGRWVQETELVPEPRTTGAQIGKSVAVDGDTALVGAYTSGDLNDRDGGDVFVFTRSDGTWSQQAILTREDGSDMDLFGSDVALDGDTAVVGAESAGEFGDGDAYVFTRSNGSWSRQANLEESGAKFGYSVAIDGDRAVVTAPGGLHSPSSAYVFERSGGSWTRTAKLAISDKEDAPERFGHSASVSGSTVVVGAPEEAVDEEIRAGTAYVFTPGGNGWGQQARLRAESAQSAAKFGADVTVLDDFLIVGAPLQYTGEVSGAVFAYNRSGGSWEHERTFEGPYSRGRDVLGAEVDTDGKRLVAGARGADTKHGKDAGAAFVFEN